MPNDHGRQGVFIGAASLVALGLAMAVLAVSGIDPEGIRRALRLTARFSFVLFWCAYAGGSLAALFGDRLRPLARQGRNFGLAFASAHSIHVLLVIWLYRLSPEPPISAQGAVFFSIGVLWMYLLALFSIEHPSKLLGPRLWRKLRLVGFEYLMLAYQADFLRHSLPADAKHLLLYAPFAALGVAGTALRIVGWARKMHNTWAAIIPTGRTVDSIVNRRDAAASDSQSPLDKGGGDDGSDHTFGPVGFRSARGVGADAGRESGASDAGDRPGVGKLVAGGCGRGLCDGPPDAT